MHAALSLQLYIYMHSAITQSSIVKVKAGQQKDETDLLAVEEPLEIRLLFGPAEDRKQQSVSVTMRTPGKDFDLAIGFLFTEGIIQKWEDITSIKHCGGFDQNVVRVELKEDVSINISKLERNFYTTSSCGVCGKASINAVRTTCQIERSLNNALCFPAELLYTLPERLRSEQAIFQNTGGLHGCALFDVSGKLILSREDVGRHNALDKLIGAALQENLIPLDNYILLLSGRGSFELVQKAWMAGVQVIAAVGAPSSLAVEMAKEAGITLVGFLRNNGFNIYSGEQRIVISVYEDSH